MNNPKINKLEDIVPFALDHLLPEIQESVEVCIKSYSVDPTFNDMWTFGTQLWKNTWNRFKAVFEEYEDCPFETCGKGNEYKFKIGNYVLRHHRINEESNLPNGGKAVKESATKQMTLFGDEWDAPVEIDNIVLAIIADVQYGLKGVFIGELKQRSSNAKQYKWGKKVPVYLADGIEASSGKMIQISNIPGGFKQHSPEEELAVVPVELDKTTINRKIKGNEPEK
jgi:hypothetical protein